MSKTITADFPARSVKLTREVKKFPAYSQDFEQDDEGKWTTLGYAIFESEVIDSCSRAANWPAIRAEHFPMTEFHS